MRPEPPALDPSVFQPESGEVRFYSGSQMVYATDWKQGSREATYGGPKPVVITRVTMATRIPGTSIDVEPSLARDVMPLTVMEDLTISFPEVWEIRIT
jgi:hypothetical protein